MTPDERGHIVAEVSFSGSRATAPQAQDNKAGADDEATDDVLPELVRSAQAGDIDGMRQLLMAIGPSVRRTCVDVLGSQHADLEDTVQESLVAAVKALPQYRFDGDIRGYVSTITLRLAIAARRRSELRWHRRAALAVHELELSTSGEATESHVDAMVLVHRMLDELGQVQSQALMMRMVLGLSIEEIAKKTGVSPNTVKSRIRRGKNSLRDNAAAAPGFWKSLFRSSK